MNTVNKKNITYTYNALINSKNEPIKLPFVPVIKWYETKLSYEEKYRFGKLTPQEYMEWMKELEDKAKHEAETFWENDEKERVNISNQSYEEFLSSNNVDISNNTTLDMEKLLSENAPQDSAPVKDYEPNLDEILSNVNKAVHGGADLLTQEEIEALFAQSAT